MIFLLTSFISAFALLLFYGMLFSIWGKGMASLLCMKIEKVLVIIVAGVVLMVWFQLWIEQVLSGYMKAG